MRFDFIKQKKGIEVLSERVIIMIVLLVGFGALLPFTLFAQDGVDVVQDSICTASIAARSNYDLPLGADFPLVCKKKLVNTGGSEEKIMKFFASNMAACWSMFGEGKLTESVDLTKSILGVDVYIPIDSAFPCFEITVNNINGNGIITRDELEDYLKIGSIQKSENDDTTYSYYDYITKANGIGGRISLIDDIEPHTTYTIYFSDPADIPGYGKYNGIYIAKTGDEIDLQDAIGGTQGNLFWKALTDGLSNDKIQIVTNTKVAIYDADEKIVD